MATVGSGGGGAFSVGTSSASNANIGVSMVDKETSQALGPGCSSLQVQKYADTIPGAIIKASAYPGMGGGAQSPD